MEIYISNITLFADKDPTTYFLIDNNYKNLLKVSTQIIIEHFIDDYSSFIPDINKFVHEEDSTEDRRHYINVLCKTFKQELGIIINASFALLGDESGKFECEVI